jgi:hypothetical protein
MSTLSDHERLALAIALLRRGARVSIVHHETGVPREKLRRLHREIHGRSAPSGQIPMVGGATIQTRAQQVYAGLFAALYVRYSELDTTRQIDIQAVIAAHDLYLSLVPQAPRLDVSAAWAIARDLRVGSAELRTCGVCEVRYLVSSASRLAPTCPFCALYARRGGRPETPLVPPELPGYVREDGEIPP